MSEPVHWTGEAPTSLHGNGASSFARTSNDAADVTCKLCLTLLARFDELATRFGLGTQPSEREFLSHYAADVTVPQPSEPVCPHHELAGSCPVFGCPHHQPSERG